MADLEVAAAIDRLNDTLVLFLEKITKVLEKIEKLDPSGRLIIQEAPALPSNPRSQKRKTQIKTGSYE